ncbi:MAG: hypothetical protein GY754_34370 [bacterium]|nr:hypothetical protein [bacterium]
MTNKTGVFFCLLLTLAVTACLSNRDTGYSKKKKAKAAIAGEKKVDRSNKFGFDEWKDQVQGPVVRFHVNFDFSGLHDPWQRDRNDTALSPGVREMEFRFSGDDPEEEYIRIVLAECDSVAAAHGFIASSLMHISRPDPPLDRPEGWDFGDVYKFGYWARDNIYVYIHDMGDSPLPDKEIKKISEAVDAALLNIPRESPETNKERPEIQKFAFTSKDRKEVKEVKNDTHTPLEVQVRDPKEDASKLRYLFAVEGGRIFRQQDRYYYSAEKEGDFTLKLYVSNSKGLSTMSRFTIRVTKK